MSDDDKSGSLKNRAIAFALPYVAMVVPRVIDGAARGYHASADGLSGALDWLASPPKKKGDKAAVRYQGPPPDGVAEMIVGLSRDLGLSDAANDYAAKRLREGGYNPEARNFGALRCLAAHKHGSDDKCVVCGVGNRRVYIRCHATNEDAILRLLLVARAYTLEAPIAPICTKCGTHDAAPAKRGSVGNVIDDLDTAWSICKFCKKIGAVVGGSDSDDLGASFHDALAGDDDKAALRERAISEYLARGRGEIGCFNCGAVGGWAKCGELACDHCGKPYFGPIPKVGEDPRFDAMIRARDKASALDEAVELGGYRSIEIHAKAPPTTDDGGETLDDIGGTSADFIDALEGVDDEIDAFLKGGSKPKSIEEEMRDASAAAKSAGGSGIDAAIAYLRVLNPSVPESELRTWAKAIVGRDMAFLLPGQAPPSGYTELTREQRARLTSWKYRAAGVRLAMKSSELSRYNVGGGDPAEESYATLRRAWSPLLAWYETADPLCPCKTNIAPLRAKWIAFENAKADGTAVCNAETMVSQWDNLKNAIRIRQRYAHANDDSVPSIPPPPNLGGVEDVGAWYDAINPFAPSEATEKKVQEVAAAWSAIKPKMDADPKVKAEIGSAYDAWLAFYKKWQENDRDVTAVNAMVIEVNRARSVVEGKRFVQDLDPSKKIKGIDTDKSTAALSVATDVDKVAKDAEKKLGEQKGPAKLIALGAAAATAVIIALKTML